MQIASRQIAMPTYRSSTVPLAHTYLARDFACLCVRALLFSHRHAVCLRADSCVKTAHSWVVSGSSGIYYESGKLRFWKRLRTWSKESCSIPLLFETLPRGDFPRKWPAWGTTIRPRLLQSYCIVIFDNLVRTHTYARLVRLERRRRV